jgi:hypothetical protein
MPPKRKAAAARKSPTEQRRKTEAFEIKPHEQPWNPASGGAGKRGAAAAAKPKRAAQKLAPKETKVAPATGKHSIAQFINTNQWTCRAAAAAAPAEATTTRIELPSQEWRATMYKMYTKREMYDMFLTVGDQSLFCHRLVLGMASKMWRAEFGRSGMAESKA